MKLLVFASTPPPLHGQSLAVQALLEALRADPTWDVVHVNPRLSRNHADIGRWRPGKPAAVLAACLRFWWLTLRSGRRTLYYVPAPAKRGALYRDWVVLACCRPFARGLVLHWHAVGLGEWLATRATPVERWITQALLGHARLALVLADAVRADALQLAPQDCRIVAGGIPDPAQSFVEATRTGGPLEVLFLGLGSREKGLFDTLEGVARARAAGLPCRLTVAGSFPDADTERAFQERIAALDLANTRQVGFVSDAERGRLLAASDVFCFPTAYPHEGQPAALLHALAFDRPIITTRWRAIPEMLPLQGVWFVEPGAPGEIAAALCAVRQSPPPRGVLRAHFLAHFTLARHVAALRSALDSLRSEDARVDLRPLPGNDLR